MNIHYSVQTKHKEESICTGDVKFRDSVLSETFLLQFWSYLLFRPIHILIMN